MCLFILYMSIYDYFTHACKILVFSRFLPCKCTIILKNIKQQNISKRKDCASLELFSGETLCFQIKFPTQAKQK